MIKFIKQKFSKLSQIGTALAFVSIFILIPLTLFMIKMLTNEYDNYDYENIVLKGSQTKAIITNISNRGNVHVNDINPKIISYTYLYNGKDNSDKFQSLDIEKVDAFKRGDSIEIVVYNNQSLIKGLNPYRLSLNLFWMLPLLMLFGSIILIYVGGKRAP